MNRTSPAPTSRNAVRAVQLELPLEDHDDLRLSGVIVRPNGRLVRFGDDLAEAPASSRVVGGHDLADRRAGTVADRAVIPAEDPDPVELAHYGRVRSP